MKALILAAGMGSRLRPLTLFRPKPLCLFYGEPLLDLAYRQLLRAGCKELAINTHHLGDQIAKHVKDKPSVYTPLPCLSHETEILGTGGCIAPLRQWLDGQELLIYNADIVANIKLSACIEEHLKAKADATMVLLPLHKKGSNPVYFDESGSIKQIGGTSELTPATFTGVHIVGSALQNLIPTKGFHHIIDSYQTLIQRGGKVQAYFHDGYWADLGTPQDYYSAHVDVLVHQDRENILHSIGLDLALKNGTWREGSESFCLDQEFRGELRRSFLFGPASLSGVQAIHQSIVYPSSQPEQGTTIHNKIVTPYGTFEL